MQNTLLAVVVPWPGIVQTRPTVSRFWPFASIVGNFPYRYSLAPVRVMLEAWGFGGTLVDVHRTLALWFTWCPLRFLVHYLKAALVRSQAKVTPRQSLQAVDTLISFNDWHLLTSWRVGTLVGSGDFIAVFLLTRVGAENLLTINKVKKL